MVKKALHTEKTVMFVLINGKLEQHPYYVDRILEGVNSCLEDDWEQTEEITKRFRALNTWLCRYNSEGPEEELLNELNIKLSPIKFLRHVLPPGFYSENDKEPKCAYVADFNLPYSPEVLAAYDFSTLLSVGKLDRINRCNLSECKKFFLGAKRAKWCSPTCGSKFRVRMKRKRDSQ